MDKRINLRELAQKDNPDIILRIVDPSKIYKEAPIGRIQNFYTITEGDLRFLEELYLKGIWSIFIIEKLIAGINTVAILPEYVERLKDYLKLKNNLKGYIKMRTNNRMLKRKEINPTIIKNIIEQHQDGKLTIGKLLKEYLRKDCHVVFTEETLRKYLKYNLGYSYRYMAVKPLAYFNPRVKVITQIFLKSFISILASNAKIVFIDESIIVTRQCKQKGWIRKGEDKYTPTVGLRKGIKLIVATTCTKVLHYEMPLSNTNAQVFISFLSRLCEKLKTNVELGWSYKQGLICPPW
jgi:hypothetical protein